MLRDALRHLLSIRKKLRERDDLIAALRIAFNSYQPCEQCEAPAAELWHWYGGYSRPFGDEVETVTPYCGPCADKAGVRDECEPAEPAEEIAAIAKVRHLLVEEARHVA